MVVAFVWLVGLVLVVGFFLINIANQCRKNLPDIICQNSDIM